MLSTDEIEQLLLNEEMDFTECALEALEKIFSKYDQDGDNEWSEAELVKFYHETSGEQVQN